MPDTSKSDTLEDELQGDLFIKLPPERVPVRFQFQMSDTPEGLEPPPLMPANYDTKHKGE